MISNNSLNSYNSKSDKELYQTLGEISDLTTPRAKSDLSNISNLLFATKNKKEPSITFSNKKTQVERTEQIEDFFRNFLLKNKLSKTLNIFQTEWYEYISRRKNFDNNKDTLPDVYLQNQRLEDQMLVLQNELDEAKIFANKTKFTWEKLRKERDFHRLHHSRVQQEKERMIKQIEKLKNFHLHYEQKYQELASKYENCMKDKMLLKMEKDRLAAKNGSLLKTVNNFEKKLTDRKSSKQNLLNSKISINSNFSDKENQKKNRSLKKNPNFTPIPKKLINPYKNEKIQPVLNKQISQLETFKGHMQTISKLKIHKKKPFLATASDDMTWKIWSLPKGELIMSGEGHNDWISDISFHPRGTHLATTSGDCTIKIWDFLNINCAWTIKDHSQPVWSLDFNFSGDFLLAGGMDHNIKMYDINYQKCRYSFRGHVDSVNKVIFSNYENKFYSASSDKTISLWDIKSGLLVNTFYGHTGSVNSISLSESENEIFSCDTEGICKLWDLRMMKEKGEINCGPYSGNGVVLDPSGEIGFMASDDCSIIVCDLVGFKIENRLKGHEDSVQDVVFDPFNKQLISCSADLSFRTWG